MSKNNDKNRQNSNSNFECDCLCRLLKCFKGCNVTIKTKSGDIIFGVLVKVKCCCVRIIEPGSMSPFMNVRLAVIRCKDIESFNVELDEDE